MAQNGNTLWLLMGELVAESLSADLTLPELTKALRRRFVMQVLEDHKVNQCSAAKALGVHRNTVARFIAGLDINLQDMRDERRLRKQPKSAVAAANDGQRTA